jgi:hypothetical protein
VEAKGCPTRQRQGQGIKTGTAVSIIEEAYKEIITITMRLKITTDPIVAQYWPLAMQVAYVLGKTLQTDRQTDTQTCLGP